MSKADYTRLATEVVKAVGGKENIISVNNCMTRGKLPVFRMGMLHRQKHRKIQTFGTGFLRPFQAVLCRCLAR